MPRYTKKILLIEDEPLLIELYNKKLKETGARVLSVKSAEEAKRILAKEKIDLIILDILLPRKDGISFLKEIRKEGKKTPVIILSNLEDKKLQQQAKRLKVKEYLLKANYTPSQIIEKIKNYL